MPWSDNTVNLEFFVVKYFRSQQQLRKLILQKRMCTININVVQGHFYENLSYESFITQKFPDLR